MFFLIFKQNVDTKKPHVVKKTDVSAFATTHYHMPEGTVDREVNSKQVSFLNILYILPSGLFVLLLALYYSMYICLQPNAQEAAELEVRRLEELQKEEEKRREEQLEKVRLRGMQAMRREHLTQVQIPQRQKDFHERKCVLFYQYGNFRKWEMYMVLIAAFLCLICLC